MLASPLAGRAPGALDDVDDVVTLLDEQVTHGHRLRDLPGRFCFLVDDGTGAGHEIGPDVTIVAHGGGRFGVALDSRPLSFEGDGGTAVAVAVGAAEAFVALRGDAWRLSETPGGASAIAAMLGLALEPVTRATRTRGYGPGAVAAARRPCRADRARAARAALAGAAAQRSPPSAATCGSRRGAR